MRGPDAGSGRDAGEPDAGPDAGKTDAGASDAGASDAGATDAGSDGGQLDAGGPDAGLVDGGGAIGCAADLDGTGAEQPALVASEIAPGAEGFVELYWRGPGTLDLASVEVRMGETKLPADTGSLEPGARLVKSANLPAPGELSVWRSGTLVSYACWGQAAPTTVQNEAVSKQLWLTQVCPSIPEGEATLHLTGAGTQAAHYAAAERSPNTCPAPD